MSMIWIYKMMLGPLLLAQGIKMRRTAFRLPEAAGQRTGVVLSERSESELRLLFVGDSTMAGVGVRHQTSALAFQVASILAKQLGRTVRWQLVAKSGVSTRQAFEFAKRQQLFPADVLVTALGVNDVTSQNTPSRFVTDYQALIQGLLSQVGAHFAVISGLPPLHLTPAAPQPLRWYLGRCAHALDEHLCRWIALQPNTAYVTLQWATDPKEMAADGYHPGENLYKKWADLLAESIVSLLSEQRVATLGGRPWRYRRSAARASPARSAITYTDGTVDILRSGWGRVGLPVMRYLLIWALTMAWLVARAVAQEKPWPVKVVIVTTFEPGEDTGDAPGEFQYWVEREHLDEKLEFPGGVRPLRMNKTHDVLGIVTGMTLANAGPSMMALGVDPRFDLTHAYFLVAGIAGVDPKVGSIGTAAWASFVINDVSRQIDSREGPPDWPYDIFVIGAHEPNKMPAKPMTDNLYELNGKLAHWAFLQTRQIAIPDTQAMRASRQGWEGYPNAGKSPAVLEGDSFAADSYWHGRVMTLWAEDWVKLWSGGRGRFAMTNMEDSAIAEAMLRLDRMHRVDYRRLMVLRVGSNYSMERPGMTAIESVSQPYIKSTSFEATWLVGSAVVHELTGKWETYRERVPGD